jgi:hypothetical protein
VAFVVPFGEASDSFFPDTLLSWMSARLRAAGHTTKVVRVYYDGRDEARDREVADRLAGWLDALAPTDVIVERAFDLAPLLHARARHGARLVMVCRGDGFDPDPRLDAWVGRAPGLYRGRTRRTPSVPTLLAELDALFGIARVDGPGLPPVRLDLAHDVIALATTPALEAPRVRTVFGDAGCPYAGDPRREPFYAGLLRGDDADDEDALSLLGCAFCPMGGDYQKTDEEALVAWIAEQARAIRSAGPETEALVLSDQAPVRYLERLVAATASLAPLRWLVAMRADVLLRERARLERAIACATAHGQVLEVYLTGFESFSDAELRRYVKGVRAAELVEAARVLRALGRAYPTAFEHSRARGHSLILWSPWTTPEELEQSLRTLRGEALTGLFSDLGRNRLRLTHELPITRAAERDGALQPSWDEGDAGAARGKGYAAERPWRFLDPRTDLAHRLARALRERLGRETELAQLLAARAHAASWTARARPDDEVARVLAGLDALEATLARWLGPARPRGAPRRGRFVHAAVLDVGAACGCGDPACDERDAWVDPETADARLAGLLARAPAGVVLAGGDAARHPRIEMLAARARASGPVGLAMPRPVPCPPGLAIDALVVDARADGPELAGVVRAARAASAVVEVRLRLGPRPLDHAQLDELADLAPDTLRAVIALDAVGLDRLAAARDDVEALAALAARVGCAFEVSPLSAGTRWRARLPVR